MPGISRSLLNPGPALLLTHIGDDVTDIFRDQPLYRRHVTEIPVMLPHPAFDGQVERHVCVMFGSVDLVDQWRSLARPTGTQPVATGAVCLKQVLTPPDIDPDTRFR